MPFELASWTTSFTVCMAGSYSVLATVARVKACVIPMPAAPAILAIGAMPARTCVLEVRRRRAQVILQVTRVPIDDASIALNTGS